MDLSGRFDFWHMLVHTRTVVPPRLRGGRWRLWGVVLLLIVAAGGAAVHFSLREPAVQPAVDRGSIDTAEKPAPRVPTW